MSADENRIQYIIKKAVKEDADEIALVVNDAYAVEYGDTGLGFKTSDFPRIVDPLADWLLEAYEKGDIFKAMDAQGRIVGMIYIKQKEEKLFFGPFAVHPDKKLQGIGSLLLKEVYQRAAELGLQCIEIHVVNHRADCITMYEKMGYRKVGEVDFPEPDALTRPATLLTYHKYL